MKKILLAMVVLGSFGLLACSTPEAETIIVEKEVVKEVIKEVPVEVEKVVEVEKQVVVEVEKQKDVTNWVFPGVYNPGHFGRSNQEKSNLMVYKATDGALDIEYKQFGEIGLKGGEGLTLIRDGVYPMFEIIPAYVAGDKPEMNLYYLMGLAFDMDQIYAVAEGTVEMRDEIYAEYSASRLPVYGDFSFAPQGLFTKKEIKNIDDLQGVKVRHYSTLGADLIRRVGLDPQIIAWAEVYTALQRGVVDAAITTPSSGTKAAFGEVTNYLTVIPQGGGLMDTIFNLDALASLDSDTQAILADAGKVGSDASKANWESEAAGNGPAKVALDGGLTYWEMDEDLVNEFVTRTAPGFKDWTDESGPNAEKWLAKALEILGR
jgi:TRAP-type C4-dicarboxylate transport system substrate-binding protein